MLTVHGTIAKKRWHYSARIQMSSLEGGTKMRRIKGRAKVTGNVLTLDRSLEDTLSYLFSLLGIAEGDDSLAQ
jgi:hypothetical protein